MSEMGKLLPIGQFKTGSVGKISLTTPTSIGTPFSNSRLSHLATAGVMAWLKFIRPRFGSAKYFFRGTVDKVHCPSDRYIYTYGAEAGHPKLHPFAYQQLLLQNHRFRGSL